MTGTPNQIELANQIRSKINADFDRVAAALRTASELRSEDFRAETTAVIAILEEKRAEILGKDRAGEFIRDWQELSGKVAQVIATDARYQAIRADREKRRDVASL